MALLSTAFDLRYLVLLCLVVGGFYRWQYTRPAAFPAPGALLTVLLLAHPPVLLLIRFFLEREAALTFTLTLFCSSLLVQRAAGPAFRFVRPPVGWQWLTGGLLLLDAAIAVSWPHLPPATRLLPGWLATALIIGIAAGCLGLLLYWFWHAQQPGRLRWFLKAQSSPALALAQHAYDQQAADLQPTDAEFSAWLRTLPRSARKAAQRAGVGLMWDMPLFRRFVLEARGHRYADFMAEHLSEEEFMRWVDATYAG
jgi:hypothetical protein